MTARRAACLTSLAWGTLMLAAFLAFQPKPPATNFTLAEFEKSDFSEWISLPRGSTEIMAGFYSGFDTNYRTVHFSHQNADPKEIIRQSLARNPQHQDEKLMWLEDRAFSLEGLFDVFLYGEKPLPSWWVRPMAGTAPVATVAFWEKNGNGYGYLVVEEPIIQRVRILQFSQQHLRFVFLEKAFPHPATAKPTSSRSPAPSALSAWHSFLPCVKSDGLTNEVPNQTTDQRWPRLDGTSGNRSRSGGGVDTPFRSHAGRSPGHLVFRRRVAGTLPHADVSVSLWELQTLAVGAKN